MADSSLLSALGFMSGTSMDGIDVALLRTDGRSRIEPLASASYPYPDAVRARLRRRIARPLADPGESARLAALLADLHAEAARKLLAGLPAPLRRADLAGFHGHTILHRPQQGRTLQIGDAARLARHLGCPVVHDFRSADVAAGGEGAPLAPVFHACLAGALERPLAIVNLGGIANLTWIGGEGELLAFDCGPANALLDEWAALHTGQPFDRDGRLAARGTVRESVLRRLLDHPFFRRPPPKSLDRLDFSLDPVRALDAADGAATLAAFTAAALERAVAWLKAPPRRWLLTGGGRRNPALVAHIRRRLPGRVEPIEAIGADGDTLEAQCFAYLAVRSWKGLPYSFPETTGVPRPVSGGRIAPP